MFTLDYLDRGPRPDVRIIEQNRGEVRDWTASMQVLLALVPAALLLVLLRRPVWDPDIFWQLKLGELILGSGGPLASEPFAALHIGEPLPAVAWAGQGGIALA